MLDILKSILSFWIFGTCLNIAYIGAKNPL